MISTSYQTYTFKMTQSKLVSTSEVSKHNTQEDCWIVIENQVWDITKFAPTHPGGGAIIWKYAGHDGTIAYSSIHSSNLIRENLDPSCNKGTLDQSTITKGWQNEIPIEDAQKNERSPDEMPPLSTIINAEDFKDVAKKHATGKTWAFYSSAATNLVTRDLNKSIFDRVLFRPRVMRNVTKVDTSSTLLGHKVSFPLMISPAAMAKLIHPDGELALARAAAKEGIVQCISTSAAYPAGEIARAGAEVKLDHPFFFQLYVDRNRANTEKLLKKVLGENLNIRGIFVTTDAAAAGKREADERVRADETYQAPMTGIRGQNDKRGGGYGRIMGGFIDPALCWDDIAWLRKQTDLPILLKGVMSADDVKLAYEYGLEGVMLSNHGGRNLDGSPPGLIVLLECHRRCPEVFRPNERTGKRFELFYDGGVRRGTSLLKAICLGVTGVGMGRPFLYSCAYGQEGVEHLIELIKEELQVAMANCGITSLDQAGPHLVNTGDIDRYVMGEASHPYARDWRQAKL